MTLESQPRQNLAGYDQQFHYKGRTISLPVQRASRASSSIPYDFVNVADVQKVFAVHATYFTMNGVHHPYSRTITAGTTDQVWSLECSPNTVITVVDPSAQSIATPTPIVSTFDSSAPPPTYDQAVSTSSSSSTLTATATTQPTAKVRSQPQQTTAFSDLPPEFSTSTISTVFTPEEQALIAAKVLEFGSIKFEMQDCLFPNLFLVLQADSPTPITQDTSTARFRVHHVCRSGVTNVGDHNHHPIHISNNKIGYAILQPDEFFNRFGPAVLIMLEIVKAEIKSFRQNQASNEKETLQGTSDSYLKLYIRKRDDVLLQEIEKSVLFIQQLIRQKQITLSQYLESVDRVSDFNISTRVQPFLFDDTTTTRPLSPLDDGLYRIVDPTRQLTFWVCRDMYFTCTATFCDNSFVSSLPERLPTLIGSSFDLKPGKLSCPFFVSRTTMKVLYDTILQPSHKWGIHEFSFIMDGNYNYQDLDQLRNMVSLSCFQILNLDLCHKKGGLLDMSTGSRSESRYDPILDLLSSPTLKSVKIRNLPIDFLKLSSLSAYEKQLDNLRHLELDFGSCQKNKDQLAKRINHLLRKTPNLTKISLILPANDHENHQDTSTAIIESILSLIYYTRGWRYKPLEMRFGQGSAIAGVPQSWLVANILGRESQNRSPTIAINSKILVLDKHGTARMVSLDDEKVFREVAKGKMTDFEDVNALQVAETLHMTKLLPICMLLIKILKTQSGVSGLELEMVTRRNQPVELPAPGGIKFVLEFTTISEIYSGRSKCIRHQPSNFTAYSVQDKPLYHFRALAGRIQGQQQQQMFSTMTDKLFQELSQTQMIFKDKQVAFLTCPDWVLPHLQSPSSSFIGNQLFENLVMTGIYEQSQIHINGGCMMTTLENRPLEASMLINLALERWTNDTLLNVMFKRSFKSLTHVTLVADHIVAVQIFNTLREGQVFHLGFTEEFENQSRIWLKFRYPSTFVLNPRQACKDLNHLLMVYGAFTEQIVIRGNRRGMASALIEGTLKSNILERLTIDCPVYEDSVATQLNQLISRSKLKSFDYTVSVDKFYSALNHLPWNYLLNLRIHCATHLSVAWSMLGVLANGLDATSSDRVKLESFEISWKHGSGTPIERLANLACRLGLKKLVVGGRMSIEDIVAVLSVIKFQKLEMLELNFEDVAPGEVQMALDMVLKKHRGGMLKTLRLANGVVSQEDVAAMATHNIKLGV